MPHRHHRNTCIRWIAGGLVFLLAALGVRAQIVADPAAATQQRPSVSAAANGVPVVNIQPPSAAGVSRNTYSQFDVQARGAILNNSRSNVQTQLGGWVQGNPWLGNGAARLILNEVNAANPSLLKGYVEVAGQRAEVVIANPAGIQVNGGGFINAAGVTLTTGQPVFTNGNLDAFLVRGGKVAIDGAGLDAAAADYTRILARAVQLNAGLWAKDLAVVAGASEVKVSAPGQPLQVARIAGIGAAPEYLLDVAALGGMYAGSIHLVGTEAGLGVTNRGTLTAQEGAWVLQTDGWLLNTGKVQARGDLSIQAAGGIANNGPQAVISAQGRAAVAGSAGIANTGGATVVATGTLDVSAGGPLDNAAGTLAANGAVHVTAAGISNAQGAIASAQASASVDSGTQALRNTGGTISAAQDAAIASGALDNDGGLIRAGGALAIDTHGQALSNTHAAAHPSGAGGLVAGGAATVAAGNLDNSSGYLAAAGSLAVAAATVHNAAGSIEANGDVTLTATSAVDNAGGTLAAGRDLALQDTAANRTLSVDNTSGTAKAGRHARVQATRLSAAGQLQAAGNLAIDLQSDFVSTTDLVAGGDASMITTGTFTNRAKVSAGQTASVTAADIVNTATGQISGAQTRLLAAGTLANRGLIDGGETRIDAASVTNAGTGRIYGDHVAIAAGNLTNDTETLAGARSDAVIAARTRLDLGVGTLVNREHALVFSAGTAADALNIGGGLDTLGHAIGAAAAVHNDSATIESLGGVKLSANLVSNTNQHLATTEQQVGSEVLQDFTLGPGDVYHPNDPATHFSAGELRFWDCETTCVQVLATGDMADGHTQYDYTRNTYRTVVTQSDPGRILAGAGLGVTAGTIVNSSSEMLAGGALQVSAASVQNVAATGLQREVDSGTAITFYRVRHRGRDGTGTLSAAYSPAETQQTIHVAPARLEGAALVNGSGTHLGGRAIAVVPGAPGTQVLTVLAGAALPFPSSALFRANPNPAGTYLVETDPRFASYRQWLSSDYLLAALNVSPATVQKRLGDGFYEQQLVREQVAELTGKRFLDGYASDEAEYQGLMAAGATFARQWQLRPGIALTPEQMARLTSDIVWLVATQVVRSDGSTTIALVPQVYVRTGAGDLAPSGALLSGRSVNLDLSGDLSNAGTIAGRTAVNLSARNLQNFGDVVGQSVTLSTAQDLQNIGGRVVATDVLSAAAGRDLEIRSTTRDSRSGGNTRTNVDRVAGLYVTGNGGTLLASAGRDVNVVAGLLDSAGSVQVGAARDIRLSTVATSDAVSVRWDAANWRKESRTQEAGSRITSGGATTLVAGRDFDARAASVEATGALTVSAGRDVSIVAGTDTRVTEEASRHKSKGLLSTRTLTTHDLVDESRVAGSSFGGKSVAITSGQDVHIQGSSVVGDRAVAIAAGRDLAIEAGQERYLHESERQEKTSGIFSGGGIGFTIGKRELDVDRDNRQVTAAASTVGAVAGNVSLSAGNHYRQVGSDVMAPAGDVAIAARDVQIVEARETGKTVTEQRFKQSGLTVQLTSPVLSAAQAVGEQMKAADNTGNGRMQALAVANSAFAVKNGLDAIRAGQGSVIGGVPNQVTSTGLDGTTTTREANAADSVGGINLSVSIGSSSSRSTTTETIDKARGSTVAAGGKVTITAAGGGSASDLLVRGSGISAGADAALRAEGDVTLAAARNTASLSGTSSSSSSSLGVSIGTSGIGVSVSASKGRGNEAGDDLTQTNTHVTAGGRVTLQSGANTTLQGAVVRGEAIRAAVGGDLRIESLQDTSTYTSRQQSVGGSVTIGAGAGGTFNASRSAVDSSYRSVVEQSGLKAGDGGFQVLVGGDTALVGGVIASNQAAVEQGRNVFGTGGTLTTTDLQNSASYSAKSASAGVGIGGSAKDLGVSGLGVGIGSDKGNASSTTASGISGLAGNTAVRSTDAETGLQRIFDKEKVRKDVEAQARITQAFGRDASKAIGDYAATQTKEAARFRDEALGTGVSAEQKATLLAKAQALEDQWGDHGTLRLLAHTVVGGLMGGGSGALGSAAGTLTAPMVADALKEAGIQGPLASVLTGLASTAVGTAVGGTTGGAAALNEVTNNYLSHRERAILEKSARACYVDKDSSACQVTGALRLKDELSNRLIANAAATCEGAECTQVSVYIQREMQYAGCPKPNTCSDVENLAQYWRVAQAKAQGLEAVYPEGWLLDAKAALDIGKFGVGLLRGSATGAKGSLDALNQLGKVEAGDAKILNNFSRDDFQQFDQFRKSYSTRTGGEWDYARVAPNDGAIPGTQKIVVLEKGAVIDRYGTTEGKYLSPHGVTYEERRLAPGSRADGYSVYTVQKPFSVEESKIGEAFGQPASGKIQYRIVTPDGVSVRVNVQYLLDHGYIK